MAQTIAGIDLNSYGDTTMIDGKPVYYQARYSGGDMLEIWAWRGPRSKGPAHAHYKGSSFFDGTPEENRRYLDDVLAAALWSPRGPDAAH